MNVWFLNLISWHLQGIIFARQNLQSTSPLLDIGNGNWNVLILRQCHVVEFVSYVSQSVQDIYFYSCQSTCTFVCTQFTENTKCVPNCFLFFFMAMFAVPRGKAYMCPHIISSLQAKGYFPPLSSPPFAALTRFPWLLGECLFLIGCRKWKWQPIRMSYKNMCFANIKWAHVSFATRDCKHSHKKKQKTIWDTFSVFSKLRTYKCTWLPLSLPASN
jgi:hypothetical protein